MRRRRFGNVRKLPSGRYQASYFHEGRRYVAEDTFRAKADAHAYLSRIETDLHRGACLDPTAGRVTVATVAERWLASNARKRSSTRARDEAILRLHVLPGLGSRAITNVTPPDVQALVNGWAEAHAPSTVHRHYTSLAAVFSYAVDSDRLAPDAVSAHPPPPVPEEARPELSAELGPDRGPTMWLGAVGGLRFAECAGVTLDRLGVLNGTVTIDGCPAPPPELATAGPGAGVRAGRSPGRRLPRPPLARGDRSRRHGHRREDRSAPSAR